VDIEATVGDAKPIGEAADVDAEELELYLNRSEG